MSMKFRLLALAVVAVQIVGCAELKVVPMKEAESKRKDCSLDVYASSAEIKRPYEVLCLIDSRTGITVLHELLHKNTVAAAIKDAKSAACQCGADAIVHYIPKSEEEVKASGDRGVATIRAIRYTD